LKLRTIGLISTLALGLLAGPLSTEAQQGGRSIGLAGSDLLAKEKVRLWLM